MREVNMPFEVIEDAAKKVAALVDPAIGRALGPVAMGDDAGHILEQFVGALGVDPATHTPAKLEQLWGDFVDALADKADLETAAAAEGTQEPPGEGHTAAEPGPDLTDRVAPPEAPPTGPTPSAPTAVGNSAPTEPSAPASEPPAEAAIPVTNPQPGNSICPTCDGWKTITKEGTEITCPTCNGKGEVLAEQAPPTAPTV